MNNDELLLLISMGILIIVIAYNFLKKESEESNLSGIVCFGLLFPFIYLTCFSGMYGSGLEGIIWEVASWIGLILSAIVWFLTLAVNSYG